MLEQNKISYRQQQDRQIEKIRLWDMHAHLSCFEQAELSMRRNHGVGTFFSSGTPQEWELCSGFLSEYNQIHYEHNQIRHEQNRNHGNEKKFLTSGILRSFGIHPWYSDQYEPEDCREFFRQCDAVGEIGMDSVWCSVPLSRQQEVFQKQLALAAKLKKPVVLHTKGQEAKIADLVRDFPEKVCVHWYSGDVESFEAFLELGCYFTFGPDVRLRCLECLSRAKSKAGKLEEAFSEKWNGCQELQEKASPELYLHMLHRIPADRLFIETDGLSAVAWAVGKESLDLQEIPEILEENLQFIAEQKQMESSELRLRMKQNLEEFLT